MSDVSTTTVTVSKDLARRLTSLVLTIPPSQPVRKSTRERKIPAKYIDQSVVDYSKIKEIDAITISAKDARRYYEEDMGEIRAKIKELEAEEKKKMKSQRPKV